jgi:two-component system, NarL family, response regulator NreC
MMPAERTTTHDDADIPRGTLSEVGRALAARPYARRGVPSRIDPIRVVLVDDHGLVRAGLRALLRGNPEISVVAEAADGESAIDAVLRARPDVVVMDLDMPNGDGLTTTRELMERVPGIHVLIVSMHAERERLLAVLSAGARGYLAKSAAERELVEAIRVVASGEVYLRPAVGTALAREQVEPPAARHDAQARMERLSRREQTVVVLTAQGFNGPEIGRQLGITAKTVDTYKQRIEEKLGLAHRTEYVRFALQADLLGPPAR